MQMRSCLLKIYQFDKISIRSSRFPCLIFCKKHKLQYQLKAPITMQQTTFINIFHCFSEKIRLDVSSESSARQRIHMKNQALFSSKDKSRKLKCRLLQCDV